jgi:hypothetical protein
MPTTTKALARGAFATSSATLYTVPSATTAVVSNIVITNTANAVATFTLALNGTSLATTVQIAPLDVTVIDIKQVINATQTITGLASAITVNFHISGVEIS